MEPLVCVVMVSYTINIAMHTVIIVIIMKGQALFQAYLDQ